MCICMYTLHTARSVCIHTGDKTSHIYELSRGGHVLIVLPGAFTVHEFHAPASWSDPWISSDVCLFCLHAGSMYSCMHAYRSLAHNWTRAWMDWTSFVDDANLMYSPHTRETPSGC